MGMINVLLYRGGDFEDAIFSTASKRSFSSSQPKKLPSRIKKMGDRPSSDLLPFIIDAFRFLLSSINYKTVIVVVAKQRGRRRKRNCHSLRSSSCHGYYDFVGDVGVDGRGCFVVGSVLFSVGDNGGSKSFGDFGYCDRTHRVCWSDGMKYS